MSETEPQSFPVTVTARHMEMTDAIRDYALKKVQGIHFGYPRIIEAKVIVDAQPHGHIAEIVIFGANHVTLEADTEHADLYAAIDLTLEKIERQMRKEKTRKLKREGHS
jgi:putative sigma-54 modulation protein